MILIRCASMVFADPPHFSCTGMVSRLSTSLFPNEKIEESQRSALSL
jgi:hypothetical protein